MSIFSYLKNSFARKKARRVFQNFGYRIDSFQLKDEGKVDYANWLNPLLQPKKVTQEEVDFFKSIIRKDSLVIDIGANTGDLTVPIALATGNKGLVLALDPNTQVFAVLAANAKLNKEKTNIVPLQFAATETDGEFYFASSEATFSNGGLINDTNDSAHGKFKLKDKVRGVHLETYLRKHFAEWIPNISFIKVDTEGNDLSVLKTVENIIADYKPSVVTEVFPTLTKQERDDLFHFFSEKGYTIYDLSHLDLNGGVNRVLLKHADEMAAPGIASNILAIVE
ncbi:MAG: FkbM family methyltransferase [Chitinophagia bacterium]